MRNIIFLSIFIFFSCDPEENRMRIINNSDFDVCFSILSMGDSLKQEIYPFQKVKSKKEGRIIKLSSWESVFDNCPDALISIIVYKNLNSIENKTKRDSLISVGNYEVKKYSYENLKNKDWKVVFPNDGFSPATVRLHRVVK